MKERIAAAIRFQTSPQVTPPLDLMHGFVLNQALEDDRRRLPVDPLQRQEAAIEPRSKQVGQVGIDFGAIRMGTKGAQQPPTHVDQDGSASRRHVPSPEQLLAGRLHCFLQRQQGGW